MQTYEEAMTQLEDIARQMESGNVPIDTLAEKLAKAQELLAFCRDRLTKVDEQVNQLLEAETTNNKK